MPDPQDRKAAATRVLVVEDRPAMRDAIVATFDREPGFTVEQAGSLEQARAKLEGVDVAILDLNLPDGCGADLIPELHAASPNAKAVVLSSSLDAHQVDQALQRGAIAALSKLDHLDQLLDTVKRLQHGTTP